MLRKRALLGLLIAVSVVTGAVFAVGIAGADPGDHGHGGPPVAKTATPIKHVVVIFQENVSFDHYFGTYPNAANTDGQPFSARARHAGGRRAHCRRPPRRFRRRCSTRPTCSRSEPERSLRRCGSTAARPGSPATRAAS